MRTSVAMVSLIPMSENFGFFRCSYSNFTTLTHSLFNTSGILGTTQAAITIFLSPLTFCNLSCRTSHCFTSPLVSPNQLAPCHSFLHSPSTCRICFISAVTNNLCDAESKRIRHLMDFFSFSHVTISCAVWRQYPLPPPPTLKWREELFTISSDSSESHMPTFSL